jgi:hypothetical protein
MFKRKQPPQNDNRFLPQIGKDKDCYVNSWVENKIPELVKEITGLIYQKDLDDNVINTFLNFGSDSDYGDSGWSVKGELNFPGPFYTGESDTCGTGIIESPNNVIFDENCMEHVMIQPRTKVELLQLWNAGAVEVFGSYYCDGNKYWTVQLVRIWWSNRNEILDHLKNEKLIKMNCNQEKRYRHYLENYAELDLRKYCFFIENGFYPTNEKLPEVEL